LIKANIDRPNSFALRDAATPARPAIAQRILLSGHLRYSKLLAVSRPSLAARLEGIRSTHAVKRYEATGASL
jgi:hypothetical protein